jgi:predicted nucleic acid-binding protein
MISFDTNVLVYATAARADNRVRRAQDLLARAMRATTSILLLQSLAEFSNVAIRKARIPANAVKTTIEAWLAVLPVQSADDSDLVLALEAVHTHRLGFWDAMLWASAQRAGVRHMLSEDFQNGLELQNVTFINPFNPENNQLIDRILPQSEPVDRSLQLVVAT